MSEPEPRAEELSAHLERVSAGEPVDSVLSDVTDGEMAQLVLVAAATQSVARADAPPVFKAGLQARLQAELLSGASAADGRGERALQPWLARLAAVLAALVMLVGSAVVASADAVHGEPLYGLKRAVEGARLSMQFDLAQRARLRLELADVRLWEIELAVDRGVPVSAAVIEDLLAGLGEAAADAEASGDEELVGVVRQASESSGTKLERIASSASPEDGELMLEAARYLEGDESGDQAPVAAPAGATAASPAASSADVSASPRPSSGGAEAEPSDDAGRDVASSPVPASAIPVAPPVMATAAPTGSDQPSAKPTAAPQAETEAPTAQPPTEPPATHVPLTVEPPTGAPATEAPTGEPTSLPTLEREDQRRQTQTAEAREPATATPTPTRQRIPQQGNHDATPTPPTHFGTAAPTPSPPPPLPPLRERRSGAKR